MKRPAAQGHRLSVPAGRAVCGGVAGIHLFIWNASFLGFVFQDVPEGRPSLFGHFLGEPFRFEHPRPLRSSVAIPSKAVTSRWARRKSAWIARSFSLRCALAKARAFLPLVRESFLARDSLLCALLTGAILTLRGETACPSERVRRCVRPTSIPTGLAGSIGCVRFGVSDHDVYFRAEGRAHHA